MRRGLADIGQYPKSGKTIADHILQGLAGIVRHGEGLQLKVFYGNGFAIPTEIYLHVAGNPSGTLKGAKTHPNGDAVLLSELEYAANMIVMFMRHDDCIDLLRQHPELRKPLLGFPDTETAIEHDGRIACLRSGGNQQGIPFATAA